MNQLGYEAFCLVLLVHVGLHVRRPSIHRAYMYMYMFNSYDTDTHVDYMYVVLAKTGLLLKLEVLCIM